MLVRQCLSRNLHPDTRAQGRAVLDVAGCPPELGPGLRRERGRKGANGPRVPKVLLC